jgi:hypothetical protein
MGQAAWPAGSLLITCSTGYGLGQRERGALGVGEVRRLSPCCDRVDALVGLARCLELAGVHVDADAAAIDLARPQLEQVAHRRGHAGSLGDGANVPQRVHRARNGRVSQGAEVETRARPGVPH